MKPCVLIGSCQNDSLAPETIVRGILELDPEAQLHPVNSEELKEMAEIDVYSWSFKTKYYEAVVNLCTMKSRTLGTKTFAESVNAVILCFNPESDSALASVEQWLPFTDEFEAEVKILVCERFQDESSVGGVQTIEAQKWCINRGFELVELNPTIEVADDDLEDDFPESLGMKRIIQALHAHIWPNLTLLDSKSKPTKSNPHTNVCIENAGVARNPSPQQNTSTSIDTSTITSEVDSMLESAINGPDDDFDKLFERLSEMKMKTENLTYEERKTYAEKVAISFWKSLGGNDSEVEGLSSDEET